jgi:hypothetical protein
LYPIAYTVVEVETKDSCVWFLETLALDLGAHKWYAMPTFNLWPQGQYVLILFTFYFFFFFLVCVGVGGVIHRIMNWILAK